MNKNRIEWLDSLRGFGIILVTFAHLSPWLPIETHIYSFHMCLFFFISGFLFKQQYPLKKYACKQIKSLLIPFLIWDLLSSAVSLVFDGDFKNVLTGFFVINGNLCWNAPIWFLLVLFIAEIIFAGIMSINNSNYMLIFILICSAVLWVIFGSYSFTFKLNLVPLALFFLALGNFVNRTFDKKILSKASILFITLAFGAFSIVFGTVLNIRISYTGGAFGNICYCIIASVSGTMLYYLIFKHWIGGNKLLGILGRNSLIIMAAQYWFFRVYDVFSQKLFGTSAWYDRGTVKALVLTIVTIALILLFVSLYKYIFRNNEKMINAAKYIGIR